MLAAPKDNLNCTRQHVLNTAEIPFKRFDLAESHCIICSLTISAFWEMSSQKYFLSLHSGE